ncbi:methyltransferase domain-containing protein [Kribbella pittospori]|uniref:Protein-L-isoaspartate O-methyltransferase n=2 Tax=Kribbella pittospori TaxID=722689 RepID=A0A4R0K988_9ACTN|nr:methyltransferase domain-containing protein [Kribbella pittospori]
MMADSLVAAGAIVDPCWQAAFTAVPRHLFVPRFYQNTDDGPSVIEESAGDVWLSTIYTDTHLVTRDDITSSSTAPSLMAAMLQALELTGDEAVLEIGTGTGYNAALLSERLASGHVVSVDIDTQLVDDARRHLSSAGYHPLLAATDGIDGYAAESPYDHIIATCRLDFIPQAWLAQLKPTGSIVTPLGAGLARITKHPDSAVASGTFLPEAAYFMPLRHQEGQQPVADLLQTAVTSYGTTRDYEYDAAIYRDNAARFWLDLTQPGVRVMQTVAATVAYHLDGSWARLSEGIVTQGGPRNLWDEVESAHRIWLRAGRPARQRYQLAITSQHQRILLDNSPNPVHELRPPPDRRLQTT